MLNYLDFFARFTDSLPHPTPVSARDAVLRIVWTIAGTIAVFMVVFGGLQYTLSNGDPQRAAKAKNTIIYSLVGLVIIISAFSIVNFVLGRV